MKGVAYNRTKIIATVGPASKSKKVLKALIEEGVDVFRMNSSHGTQDDHLEVIEKVRELNAEMGTHVALLLDLQGPKIRIQNVEKNTKIKPGGELIITTKRLIGNSKRVSTSYKRLPQEVKKGDSILIDDGKIELEVKEVDKVDIITKVLCGGSLLPRKGVNLPDSNISISSLTKKDFKDIEFGIKEKVDWIALSFVRKADDVRLLKETLNKRNPDIRIIAKIEKPEALDNIDAIIEEADAIMVARGDLGVEVWMGEVPIIQKKLIEKCKKATKPVIVATQIMESMIYNPRPTRAEINDVANAVMDGADALMLSAETATGKYPIEAMNSMMRTISSIEKKVNVYYRFQELDTKSPTFIHDSLILVASKLAKQVDAKAIVGMTASGYTAYKSSAQRPHANIFIFTGNKNILNTMSMVWGVRAYLYKKQTSTDETIKDVGDVLKRDGHLKSGDVFISLASMPIHERNRTNMLKINKVE